MDKAVCRVDADQGWKAEDALAVCVEEQVLGGDGESDLTRLGDDERLTADEGLVRVKVIGSL